MTNYRRDTSEEEEEALFRSYPYTLYFVQSPSTPINVSHANTVTNNYAVSEPEPEPEPANAAPARLTYSSSRGSNDSFPKKINIKYSQDMEDHENEEECNRGLVKNNAEDLIDDEEIKGSWVDYFSFSYSDSGWWVFLQLGWRFLLSLILAFLVFYIAAKPPAPKVSIKLGGIRAFRLGEGVDGSGVTTKLISCNCSVELTIDNNSNLFALHVHPPTLGLLFARLPFATSHYGREIYVGSNDITLFRLSVGTRNKAMYGAGRNMQDLLQSGVGLPLVIRVSFASSFRVLWGIFASRYNHEARCYVVVSDAYDKKLRTQVYNSTCSVLNS